MSGSWNGSFFKFRCLVFSPSYWPSAQFELHLLHSVHLSQTPAMSQQVISPPDFLPLHDLSSHFIALVLRVSDCVHLDSSRRFGLIGVQERCSSLCRWYPHVSLQYLVVVQLPNSKGTDQKVSGLIGSFTLLTSAWWTYLLYLTLTMFFRIIAWRNEPFWLFLRSSLHRCSVFVAEWLAWGVPICPFTSA